MSAKKKSLVEQALEVHRGRKSRTFSKEEQDLARAFVQGQVGVTQVTAALGKKAPTAGYMFLTNCLRYCILNDVNLLNA